MKIVKKLSMKSVRHILSNKPKSMTVLIIAAMHSEQSKIIDRFQQNYDIVDNHPAHNMHSFQSRNLNVKIGMCGIGMVNAASNTMAMIRDYKPDFILNLGCAGAHTETLKIGDIVVGSEYIPTTSVVINSKNDVHYYGHRLDEYGKTQSSFKADDILFKIASYGNLLNDDYSIYNGPIGSSDLWNESIENIHWMHTFFKTVCEDMEASAIAQVSESHEIPFLSIKDISNSVYQIENEFNPYSHQVPDFAGMNSAHLIYALCERLSIMIVD